MVQGCVVYQLPGYRNRGRQRRRWTDDITEWTGMKINEAAASAEDRDCWKEIGAYYAPPTLALLMEEEGTERRRR